MNHSSLKILRFEFKSNYMMCVYVLFVSILLMLFSLSTIREPEKPHAFDILFPIFTLTTMYFTWNSYQESLKMQTFQMYHLLPISLNTKFFSKLFITFIVFPALVLSVFIILISIHNTILSDKQWVIELPTEKHLLMASSLWILCHSICTFFAIVFKRNKALYSVITISLIILTIALLDKAINELFGISIVDPLLYGKANPLTSTLSNIFPVVLYMVSYHLFKRRQL